MKRPSKEEAEKGTVYYGEWLDGTQLYHGKGILISVMGEIFEGWFFKGSLVGQARLINIDGDIYDGQFHNNKPNGQGALREKGGLFYRGEFVNGKFEGNGSLTYPNEDIY